MTSVNHEHWTALTDIPDDYPSFRAAVNGSRGRATVGGREPPPEPPSRS
jgi:hypothetical protein